MEMGCGDSIQPMDRAGAGFRFTLPVSGQSVSCSTMRGHAPNVYRQTGSFPLTGLSFTCKQNPFAQLRYTS
jgi:hypothetical protein